MLVETDIGKRLMLADQALRLALMTFFDYRIVNEQTFSAWETTLAVLGL